MMSELETTATSLQKSAASRKLPQGYIRSAELESLALEHWTTGIDYKMVMARFNVNKRHARDVLNRNLGSILFTQKRQSPQRYYPLSRKAEVLERNSAAMGYTGATTIDITSDRADTFLQALLALGRTPRAIHKLQLETWVDKALYNDIRAMPIAGNKKKLHTVPIKGRAVTYTFHTTGRILIDIASSDTPFPLASEADLSPLWAFFGQVYDILLQLLSDPHERHTPDLMSWVLKRCDLNRDIPITDKAQFTLPDIQLLHLDRVFRLYVKAIGRDPVYRAEEAIKSELSIHDALDTIVHPNKQLEQKLDTIIEMLGGRET